MACRKMNEDVAYARNTESGCKRGQSNFTIVFILAVYITYIVHITYIMSFQWDT